MWANYGIALSRPNQTERAREALSTALKPDSHCRPASAQIAKLGRGTPKLASTDRGERQCPDCGYMLSAFDMACPCCERFGNPTASPSADPVQATGPTRPGDDIDPKPPPMEPASQTRPVTASAGMAAVAFLCALGAVVASGVVAGGFGVAGPVPDRSRASPGWTARRSAPSAS